MYVNIPVLRLLFSKHEAIGTMAHPVCSPTSDGGPHPPTSKQEFNGWTHGKCEEWTQPRCSIYVLMVVLMVINGDYW